MSIKDDIQLRLKTAMKTRNELEKSILRVVLGEVNTLEFSQSGKTVEDDQVIKVLRKVISSNQETIGYCTDPKMKSSLEEENVILNSFVPKILGLDEIVVELQPILSQIQFMKEGAAIGFAVKHLKQSGKLADGTDVRKAVMQIKG